MLVNHKLIYCIYLKLFAIFFLWKLHKFSRKRQCLIMDTYIKLFRKFVKNELQSINPSFTQIRCINGSLPFLNK